MVGKAFLSRAGALQNSEAKERGATIIKNKKP